MGGDLDCDDPEFIAARFQSTPPVWAETGDQKDKTEEKGNFNPLRPCGRRRINPPPQARRLNFNPLRPCGRRLIHISCDYNSAAFQSTPPVWAETLKGCGSDGLRAISIHSARVGGDLAHSIADSSSNDFNPLRPCGRRLAHAFNVNAILTFQSTPPMWAETRSAQLHHLLLHNFNPLRPCGRRLAQAGGISKGEVFQSTPPMWAETCCQRRH